MPDPDIIRLLWFLLAGTRGGDNRIKILDLLLKNPLNINKISKILNLSIIGSILLTFGILSNPTISFSQQEPSSVIITLGAALIKR